MSRFAQDAQGNLDIISGNANYAIIAPKEISPATAPHVEGSQLIYGNALYEVIEDIAIDDTLTIGTNITAAPDITTQIKNKVSKGVEVVPVTTTSIVNSIQVKKAGNVVTATLSITPTEGGFSSISSNFPKPAIAAMRVLGINSGGEICRSWIVIYDTGNVNIYSITSELNTTLLFSIAYVTTD